MKTATESVQLWKCPQCGRQFERRGQPHSCRHYPLQLHFEGKPAGKHLYEEFKQAVQNKVGNFKIESLECCIHFVCTGTFAAVDIFRDKIRVDFSLSRRIQNKKIKNSVQMSAHRYLYYIDIMKEDEIGEELMEYIQEAHDLKQEKLAVF